MADTLPGFGAGPDDEEPDLEDLEDLEEPELQSGLGRGLAAIIPTLADLDTPSPSAGRRRRRRGGVEALLGTPAAVDEPVDQGEGLGGVDGLAPQPVTTTPTPHLPIAPEVAAAATGTGSTEVDPERGAARTEVLAPGAAEDAGAGPAVAPVPSVSEGEAVAEPRQVPARSAGEAVAGPIHVPAPSAVRKLRDDLVGALLDGLANTMALDLCAYLHEGPGEAPHLFLQSPSMDAIGADRTYVLFDALRRALGAGRSEPAFCAAGFFGVGVATLAEGSRGLWAVARAEDITEAEREVATRFCRSFGRAVHQLDGAAAPANTIARPLQVEVHRARDSVLAEVQVRIGDQIRSGHGRASTRVEAITRAVLVAAGRHVTFRYASEVAHEAEHAAVVLLEGGDHAVALGSALSPESGGVATARAALRALDGLTP